MGISTTKSFIYFVIPKTASSTVRKALDQHRDVKRPTEHFSEHVTIKRFRDSPYAQLLESYFKFSFVRNPYDRLYSGFLQDRFAAYNLPHWQAAKQPIFRTVGEDFNRYVCEFAAHADLLNDPFWICFCPMHAFTHVDGKLAIDWIGRTEHLESDLVELSHLLGIEIKATPKENVRSESLKPGRHLRHYRRETVETVNRLYADDFAYFGYKRLSPSAFSA